MKSYKNWTSEQVSFLIENYGKISTEMLSKTLSKSVGSIYYILKKEEIDVEKQWWTKDEITKLKELYPSNSNQELEEIFSRSEDAIQLKAAALGLKKSSWWSEEDTAILREMVFERLSHAKMAEILGRTKSAIHNKLMFEEPADECRRWTDKELETIQEMANSGNNTYLDIAIAVNATPGQIRQTCTQRGWRSKIKRTMSYGNDKMISLLKKIFPNMTIEQEFHIGEKLRLDAYIKKLNLGFEYDGIQHFRFTPIWHKTKADFIRAQEYDKRKNELCILRNITLIRIRYNEDLTEELLQSKINIALADSPVAAKDQAPAKPKAKIPHPKEYKWPKGKKIPGRRFNGEPISQDRSHD